MKNNTAELNKWEDVDAKTSRRSGIAGILETALRRFRVASYLAALIPLYFIAILAMGIAATPAVFLLNFIYKSTAQFPIIFHYGAIAWALVAGFFVYGLTLIFVVPFFNLLIPFKLKPFRGGYYSLAALPWYFHNAFTYIVRFTFLNFITPTPINILFYRMMGMKIGKGVHINTTNISDPCLIQIEDKVTIGGSVHIIAHYASKGYLIVKPVKIGRAVTVGLKATIMGDVEIGEGAVIAPHEVVLPKSRIAPGRKPHIQTNQDQTDQKEVPTQDFF